MWPNPVVDTCGLVLMVSAQWPNPASVWAHVAYSQVYHMCQNLSVAAHVGVCVRDGRSPCGCLRPGWSQPLWVFASGMVAAHVGVCVRDGFGIVGLFHGFRIVGLLPR